MQYMGFAATQIKGIMRKPSAKRNVKAEKNYGCCPKEQQP